MARFRLSRPAQADLEQVLTTSGDRWGEEGRRRYAALLITALDQVAANPEGPATRNRPDLLPGIRSFHLRNARREGRAAPVKRPVHVIYYRAVQPDIVEIVRILHERMDPALHVTARG